MHRFHDGHDSRWHRYPRPVRFVMMAAAGIVFASLFVMIVGGATQWLWNWVIPSITTLPAVTFWQAVAILVLARLLVGRFSGGHGMHGHRRFGRHHRHHHAHDDANAYEAWWREEGEADFRYYLSRKRAEREGKNEA